MSHRKYPNRAERQRAYRKRLREKLAGLRPVNPLPKERKKTRPQRLQEVCHSLQTLLQEYQHWLDTIPENLSESPIVSQLQETIEQMQDILELLQSLDLPRGFGR